MSRSFILCEKSLHKRSLIKLFTRAIAHTCFFFAETFRSFVSYTVVLKLALTVFANLPFQAL